MRRLFCLGLTFFLYFPYAFSQSLVIQGDSSIFTVQEKINDPAINLFLSSQGYISIMHDWRFFGLNLGLNTGLGLKSDPALGSIEAPNKVMSYPQLNELFIQAPLNDFFWLSLGKKRFENSVLLWQSSVDFLRRPSIFLMEKRLASSTLVQGFSEGFYSASLEMDWEWLHQSVIYIPDTTFLDKYNFWNFFNSSQSSHTFNSITSIRILESDVRFLNQQVIKDRDDVNNNFGLIGEFGIGNFGTIKFEAALRQKLSRVEVINTLGLFNITDADWVAQAGAALTVSTSDKDTSHFEYLFNNNGFYGDDYQKLLDTAKNNPQILVEQGLFQGSKHYLFFSQDMTFANEVKGSLLILTNLQDFSGIFGGNLTFVQDDWTLIAYIRNFYGKEVSEGALFPRSTTVGVNLKVKVDLEKRKLSD